MANLWQSMTRPKEREISLDQLIAWVKFNGAQYPLSGYQQTLAGDPVEMPDPSYLGYIQSIYKQDGVVWACMRVRKDVFSEVRFQWQQLRNGKPGKLFGNQDLAVLEEPWPGGTTGDWLGRAMQDIDLAGNHYAALDGEYVRRLRPDWVNIVLSAPPDQAYRSDILGYIYTPGGPNSGAKPQRFLREEVCHFAPNADPAAQYRGMSWLDPIVADVMGDRAATEHKLKFFEQGATPNVVVEVDPTVKAAEFQAWVDIMKAQTEGVEHAYKTMYLGGGSTAKVVGANMRQIDFRATQAAGEVRIAVAAGVHPALVGILEGLSGSSLNEGNFTAARRLFADGTLRPLWRNFCGSVATLLTVPGGARLWYDPSDIAFLQDDEADAASIQQRRAAVVYQLIAAGFEPESVVQYIITDDYSVLEHSKLYSVQLQPAGAGSLSPPDVTVPNAPTNGQLIQDPRDALRALLAPFTGEG